MEELVTCPVCGHDKNHKIHGSKCLCCDGDGVLFYSKYWLYLGKK